MDSTCTRVSVERGTSFASNIKAQLSSLQDTINKLFIRLSYLSILDTIERGSGAAYLMHKWLSSSPSTPPSSNAAEVFWNNGSTSNSKSKLLMSRALVFRSIVCDACTVDCRWMYMCSMQTQVSATNHSRLSVSVKHAYTLKLAILYTQNHYYTFLVLLRFSPVSLLPAVSSLSCSSPAPAAFQKE